MRGMEFGGPEEISRLRYEMNKAESEADDRSFYLASRLSALEEAVRTAAKDLESVNGSSLEDGKILVRVWEALKKAIGEGEENNEKP